MPKTHPNIMVTSQDFERIQQAMSTSRLDVDKLDNELERANLVNPKDVPPHVITMNSELVYEDMSTGVQRQARLVYPVDSNVDKNWISVLAPLGTALLGLKEGDEIDWVMPGGTRRLRIVKIVYQPEAAGDWSL